MSKFSRMSAGLIAAMLASAMSIADHWDRRQALQAIPEYRSRGKGRGQPGPNYHSRIGGAHPHQGAREMARRLRQRAALEAKRSTRG